MTDNERRRRRAMVRRRRRRQAMLKRAAMLCAGTVFLVLAGTAFCSACEPEYIPAVTVEAALPELMAMPESTPVQGMAEQEPPKYTQAEIDALARMAWGEARGCTKTAQAATMWCALNRVDDPRWPDTLLGVIEQDCQFYGYDPGNPLDPELQALAVDVLDRYYAEKDGLADSGRVLPAEYVYFTGDGWENWFRVGFHDDTFWDWSLESPYTG